MLRMDYIITHNLFIAIAFTHPTIIGEESTPWVVASSAVENRSLVGQRLLLVNIYWLKNYLPPIGCRSLSHPQEHLLLC